MNEGTEGIHAGKPSVVEECSPIVLMGSLHFSLFPASLLVCITFVDAAYFDGFPLVCSCGVTKRYYCGTYINRPIMYALATVAATLARGLLMVPPVSVVYK